MLARVRRKLREIRYYSAPRRDSAWSRAIAVAVLAAIPVALLAVWAADAGVERGSETTAIDGRLRPIAGGRYEATLLESATFGEGARRSFSLRASRAARGWPFTTSRGAPRVALDMDPDSGAARVDVRLAPDHPMHTAIATAIESTGDDDLLLAWTGAAPGGREPLVRGWIGSTIAWWLALALASIIAIRSLQLAAAIRGEKRKVHHIERRRGNKCATCGYDLRGLEFNERCPECGTLVW